MKEYAEKEITYKRKVFKKMNCDMCNKESIFDDNWSDDRYGIGETYIGIKTGFLYPEGGETVELSADICTNCFTNEIIPFLISKGVKMKKEEVDI